VDDLRRFERLVADALTAPDPVAALRAAEGLPGDLAAAVEAAGADGLRMTALIVARLRFERLMHGCTPAIDWFERDPAAFAAAFRRYHHGVPPTAHDPRGEDALFRDWLRESRDGSAAPS
jgi:hypothetical protein